MENQIVSEVSTPRGNAEDHIYDQYLGRIAAHFRAVVDDGKTPLFTTDAEGLWEAYLAAFPDDQRQFHNCSACRSFINHFGGLVWISSIGLTGSAIWDEEAAPLLYKASIAAMSRIVRRAKITGVFLSPLEVWGQPETGIWRHFAIKPPSSLLFKHAANTAGQAMAEKREDFNNVSRALAEFTAPMLDQALVLLKSEALYRSEKVLGQAQWLHELHTARAGVKGAPRDNALWLAIAKAPAGFCHPRGSMIGTLLEDLASGMDFNVVAERFKKKMDPKAYQRPQAAPTAGAIDAAEKLVEKLGVARSLERRFARLDELQAIWTPVKEEAPAGGGVFAHLQPKNAGAKMPERVMPARTMTWDKFARTVLPEAKQIAIYVPPLGVFAQLVTAEHADAPPLLQWDRLEQRNPVAWYVGREPTHARRWELSPGSWITLTAITRQPNEWFGGDFPHHGEGAFLIIKGAKDSQAGHGGLFPENLKAEFHGIRSVIEAYSKTSKLGGLAEASACGIMMRKGAYAGARLQVAMPNGVVGEYIIDRWD